MSNDIRVLLRTACGCERFVHCLPPKTEEARQFVVTVFSAETGFTDTPGLHRRGIRRFKLFRDAVIPEELPVYLEIVGDAWAEERYQHFVELSKVYGVDIDL